MIFRQKIIVDWEELKQLRKEQHIANNIKENRHRREHQYKTGDLVLIIMKSYERNNVDVDVDVWSPIGSQLVSTPPI